MEFSEVIVQRHSVRNYEETPVSKEELLLLLDHARLAPSWVNKQCWRFVIITEKETIQDINKHSSAINRWIKNAPCLILACADPTESGHTNNQDYYLVDTAIAMEHLILSATNQGLGSCWIGGYNEDKIKELLLIPKRIRIVAMTPIGHVKQQQSMREKVTKTLVRSTKRKSLEEIVHWEKW